MQNGSDNDKSTHDALVLIIMRVSCEVGPAIIVQDSSLVG